MDERLQRVTDSLNPGERIVWSGAPDPKVWFTPADLILIPFSVVWCAFVTYWIITVFRSPQPGVLGAVGVLFVLIGLYLLVARPFIAHARRSRSTLVLTDQRAIVATGQSSFESTPIESATITQRWSRDRRHTTVVFGQLNVSLARGIFGDALSSLYGRMSGMDFLPPGRVYPVSFDDVADAEALETALGSVRNAGS